jgi:hypothetical protein
MRLYDDDEIEAASIIAWTERRLEHSDSGMVRFYANEFKKMWLESFGSLENVPQEFKDKVETLYDELKEKENR